MVIYMSDIVLGFDFGNKYIGVATGQTITKTVTPLTSLKAKNGIPNPEDIKKLFEQWQPKAIIVGLPLNMDGSNQHITFAAKKFGNRLKEQFKVPVHWVDERLSSWEAKNNNPNSFDELNADAAAIILQQWLNSNTA